MDAYSIPDLIKLLRTERGERVRIGDCCPYARIAERFSVAVVVAIQLEGFCHDGAALRSVRAIGEVVAL